MIPLRLSEIADVVGGSLHGEDVLVSGPAYGDSRRPVADGLFVAIVGEHTDGHAYADGAHAVVLMSEWAEFSDLDPADLRSRMAYPILVDARNALDAEAFVAAGFTVAGVGRPVRAPADGSR